MPSSSSGSLIFPVLIWDKNPPECHISSILINENENYILTGTTSGHIIIWDFKIDEITPKWLMIGHTSVVNCLSKAGYSKDEEYIVSSSENGEMKLWELNEKKCIESIKMPNTIHKKIYSSKLNGKYYRLFCIGNYIDVLVIDPISLDILYTLASREQHECIKALCINSLSNQNDDVIVGVSISGVIKLWTLNANEVKGSEIVEHEYRKSVCENANTISSCPGKQRIFIIVCPNFFQIFDAVDFTVLSQVHISSLYLKDDSISFINGFFVDIERVLVATSDGKAYLYNLPENINPSSSMFRKYSDVNNKEKYFKINLISKFISNEKETFLNSYKNHIYCMPVFFLYEIKKRSVHLKNDIESAKNEAYQFLIKADSVAKISLWNIKNNETENIKINDYQISLNQFWKENCLNNENDFGTISTLIYIHKINKLVYGMSDGTILIRPAIEFLMNTLFGQDSYLNKNIIKIKKHTAKVTCILYPYSEHPRYDPSILVSGSLDFSIILWNINSAEMIHKFVVQTGEILQLSVPPNNVNPRILQCICSISSDHSVALLSLKECKPIMIASRHLFPVLFIKWRPLDDYLIVKCSDGGVFVWQIETGNLDRVAHGLAAEDILNAADELAMNPELYSSQLTNTYIFIPSQNSNIGSHHLTHATHVSNTTPMILSNKSISNQNVALAHLLQKRNFSHAIKTINQKLASAKEDSKKSNPIIDSSCINFPLIIHPFHLSYNNSVRHLFLFDIDNLLTTLAIQEYSIEATVKHIQNSFLREVYNIPSNSTELILPSQREYLSSSPKPMKKNASANNFESIDMKQLNLLKNKLNYSLGIVNLANVLLSSLHNWSLENEIDKVCVDILGLKKPFYPVSFGKISRGAHIFIMFPPKKYNCQKVQVMKKIDEVNSDINNPFIPASKSLNLINFDSEEELNNSSTIAKSIDQPTEEIKTLKNLAPPKEYWLSNKLMNTEHLLAILALSNSLMNLNYLPDFFSKNDIDPLDIIIHSNQNNQQFQNNVKHAYSQLSTMYYMISDYSNSKIDYIMKPLSLEILALKWMDPSHQIREVAQTLIKSELKKIGTNGRTSLIKNWEPHLNTFLKEFDDLTLSLNQNSSSVSKSMNTEMNQLTSEMAYLSPNSNRIRRKQFVAIIILSVIGAEFGQDINDFKNEAQNKKIPKGFSLEDHTNLKNISNILSELVTNKTLQYDITRRASIDLMGRGFNIWEPFIQPSSILTTLLELTADSELHLPRFDINLPLTAAGDLCKIARNSLNIIANSRPETFILTITKEIKRINSSSIHNNTNSSSFNSTLARTKPELIKIIERLIDNQFQVIYELLPDVMEIVLFVYDPNQMKNLPFDEIFPILFKYPMIKCCKESKRIVCGCNNGRLFSYEYKAGKWNTQTYQAHNGQPIVAIAISSDAKYIATYSAHDNSLVFWQFSGTNIFNIGSSTIKQIKICNAAPLELNVPLINLAHLFWQNKTLNLIYHDKRKFSYQI